MIDMETSKPLDKALDFNPENIFEYIEFLLHNINADLISSQSEETMKELYEYINSLSLPDVDAFIFEAETIVNHALCQTSQYAYKAGFMEACRLMQTLRSF